MMDAGIKRHAQFGANTVCPADQHRILVASSFEVKHTSKTPDHSV